MPVMFFLEAVGGSALIAEESPAVALKFCANVGDDVFGMFWAADGQSGDK